MKPLVIIADGLKVSGPKVDGTYSLTFTTGEYQRDEIANALRISPGTALRVTIEVHE
jgi:hypothetical protein